MKHAGVRNYIALAWSQEDLEACADLNLPCADVSSLLIEPISECRGAKEWQLLCSCPGQWQMALRCRGRPKHLC